MRIGILTLPLYTNYGGILQAVALKTIIEKLGNEVVFFDKPKPKDISLGKKIIKYPIRAIKKYIFNRDLEINWEYKLLKKPGKIYRFIDKSLTCAIINSIKDIHLEDIDTLVIGSDQVWRYIYWKIHYKDILDAFGKFALHKCKVLSYAASFGREDIDEYPKESITDISDLLKQFHKVSVRESSGVKICKDYFDVDAVRNLDPTFLITKSEWSSVCKKIPKTEGKIVTYILDPSEKTESIRNYMKSLLRKEEVELRLDYGEYAMPGPDEWLAAFRDANFIVTDSFHGAVFSIIFEKPFIVMNNNIRGNARIDSLLALFHLSHHKVGEIQEIKDLYLYDHAVKTKVILRNERDKSLEWIREALSNAND